jgi:hypothetical protein
MSDHKSKIGQFVNYRPRLKSVGAGAGSHSSCARLTNCRNIASKARRRPICAPPRNPSFRPSTVSDTPLFAALACRQDHGAHIADRGNSTAMKAASARENDETAGVLVGDRNNEAMTVAATNLLTIRQWGLRRWE